MTSAERIVLDASAAIALLRAEPEAAAVARAVALAAGEGTIVVPDVFWFEVENVLVRRHHWEAEAVVEAFRLLDELGIETAAVDRPLLLLALEFMTAAGLTAYDAAYLALAELEDATLITLDQDLSAAASSRAVDPGRYGTREGAAAYVSSSVAWARHGRYLAALRDRAAIGRDVVPVPR